VCQPEGQAHRSPFPGSGCQPVPGFRCTADGWSGWYPEQDPPGEAADKNLYDLPPEEDAKVPTVAESLEVALAALKADHDFLLKGGVFTKEMLEAYIELKTEEARLVSTQVHPIEFELYYSC
jgi:glutamine synthetase